jgi:hypothetical protein
MVRHVTRDHASSYIEIDGYGFSGEQVLYHKFDWTDTTVETRGSQEEVITTWSGVNILAWTNTSVLKKGEKVSKLSTHDPKGKMMEIVVKTNVNTVAADIGCYSIDVGLHYNLQYTLQHFTIELHLTHRSNMFSFLLWRQVMTHKDGGQSTMETHTRVQRHHAIQAELAPETSHRRRCRPE